MSEREKLANRSLNKMKSRTTHTHSHIEMLFGYFPVFLLFFGRFPLFRRLQRIPFRIWISQTAYNVWAWNDVQKWHENQMLFSLSSCIRLLQTIEIDCLHCCWLVLTMNQTGWILEKSNEKSPRKDKWHRKKKRNGTTAEKKETRRTTTTKYIFELRESLTMILTK